MDLKERLFGLCEPVFEESGYELVWVEVAGLGKRRKARLFIDKEGGVDVDDCTRASRIIAPVIEEHGLFMGSYVLEVSSPGLERPLFRETDFARFKGRKVRLRLRNSPERRKNLTGTLKGITEKKGLLLELDGGRTEEIPLKSVSRANLVFEWK